MARTVGDPVVLLTHSRQAHSVLMCAHPADGPEPEYQPDSAYPPWVFKLLEEKPLLEDIVMKGMEKVPREQMKSVFRMANKRQIKEANTKRRKE